MAALTSPGTPPPPAGVVHVPRGLLPRHSEAAGRLVGCLTASRPSWSGAVSVGSNVLAYGPAPEVRNTILLRRPGPAGPTATRLGSASRYNARHSPRGLATQTRVKS